MSTRKKKSEAELEAKLKKVNEERRRLNKELRELREKELTEKKELAYNIVCQMLKRDNLLGMDRKDIIDQVNRRLHGVAPAAPTVPDNPGLDD